MRETLYKTKGNWNTILSKVHQIGGIRKCFIMGFYGAVNVSFVYIVGLEVAVCLSTLKALVCLSDSSGRGGG